MEIVRKGAWNACKLLASSTFLCEIKGVHPECRPIVAGTHHFGYKEAFSGIKTTDPIMKLSHDIICLLAV